MSKNESTYNDMLKGKTIEHVRRMSRAEATANFWSTPPLIVFFTDGTYMMPQTDSEGNDGGILQYVDTNTNTMYVI